jgi:hypothetical protein
VIDVHERSQPEGVNDRCETSVFGTRLSGLVMDLKVFGIEQGDGLGKRWQYGDIFIAPICYPEGCAHRKVVAPRAAVAQFDIVQS